MSTPFPLQPSAESYLRLHGEVNLRTSAYAIPYLLRYNMACIVDLAERRIVDGACSRNILRALQEVAGARLELDPRLEDLQPNLERQVAVRAGEDAAGWLTVGRARRECGHIAQYLAMRAEALDLLGTALDLDACLLERARGHLETAVPYYTGLRRAEPITFGYYLASFAEELETGIEAAHGSYGLFRRSTAGSGNIIPGPVPLDRGRVAALLGMAETTRHSLYGQNNIDVPLAMLSAGTMLGTTMLRMVTDLSLWHSSDIGIVGFSDALSGGSFIMPQKRNASWMRPVRRLVSEARSRYLEASESLAHSVPMSTGDLLATMPLVHEGFAALIGALSLTREAMAGMAVNAERGRELAGKDLTQSLELVGVVMRHLALPWREAEHLVTLMTESAKKADPADPVFTVASCQQVIEAEGGGRWTVPEPALRDALDVRRIIESRGDSGPQPAAVARHLEEQAAATAQRSKEIATEKSRLDDVWTRLDERVRDLAASEP